MISINNNLMAANTAVNLSQHYGRLQTSTQRLSSGLRINGAADDAAGLAIRELMRADIAALNQGSRNVNDAISMLQTFDGALGVIDEKLIRMKELAEQAATGTYDSTQRLMIDSEFQAMGREIDRIARATDFNGVKLLYGEMITWYEDVTDFWIDNKGSVDNLTFTPQNATTPTPPILKGADPNDYIDRTNPEKEINVRLTAIKGTREVSGELEEINPGVSPAIYNLPGTDFTAAVVGAIGGASAPNFKYSEDPANPPTKVWKVGDANRPNYTNVYVDPDTKEVIGTYSLGGGNLATSSLSLESNGKPVDPDPNKMDQKISSLFIDTANKTFEVKWDIITFENDPAAEYVASYDEDKQTVRIDLNSGGSITMRLDNPLQAGHTIALDINFKGAFETRPVERHGVDPNQSLIIHFGPENDSAEDYYSIKYQNCTLDGLNLDGVRIETQQAAQEALVTINDAIISKDKARAYFGAMQNRLENTLSVNTIQSENLQAAESRISDTDIALEMTQFVCNQILTQSAVAMLAQANSLSQLVLRLL